MGEITYLSRERIQITVYMRSDGPGRRRSQCHHECDLTLVLVNGLVKELGQWYFDVRTRSWPSHVLETRYEAAGERRSSWSAIALSRRLAFPTGPGCAPISRSRSTSSGHG